MVDRVLLRSGSALLPPLFMRAGEMAFSPQDSSLWLGGPGGVPMRALATAAAPTAAQVAGALGYTPLAPAALAPYALASSLAPYALTASLAPYALTASLAPYALTSALQAAIAPLQTAAQVAGAVAPYALTTALQAAVASLQSAVAALAPLASPTFTGTPTAPGYKASTSNALASTLGAAYLYNDGTNLAARGSTFYVQTTAGVAGPLIAGAVQIGADQVNYITASGNSANFGPTIAAQGSPANVPLNLQSKGGSPVQCLSALTILNQYGLSTPQVACSGAVSLTALPTSASGLAAGQVWRNGNVLNIV